MREAGHPEDRLLEDMTLGINSLLTTPATRLGQAEELADLLNATNARAVGCWGHERGVLYLAGFLSVEAMPEAVQAEFVAATRIVPLTQTQFGIVQAVVQGGPAVNHRAMEPLARPEGSIGWLGRFEAASSLAMPIRTGKELRGAIAVATERRIEPEDAVWRLVLALANRLG